MTQAPLSNVPDTKGRFGQFGGVYVPETLVAALDQLESEYARAKSDPDFHAELTALLSTFVGRRSVWQENNGQGDNGQDESTNSCSLSPLGPLGRGVR